MYKNNLPYMLPFLLKGVLIVCLYYIIIVGYIIINMTMLLGLYITYFMLLLLIVI